MRPPTVMTSHIATMIAAAMRAGTRVKLLTRNSERTWPNARPSEGRVSEKKGGGSSHRDHAHSPSGGFKCDADVCLGVIRIGGKMTRGLRALGQFEIGGRCPVDLGGGRNR